MNKIHSLCAVCMALMLLLVITVPGFASTANPATGTPTVEIDLGADNAGAEFYFKTDAGIMPGTLKADQNGSLTVELGGSSRYILTYAGAVSGMPSASETEESVTGEPATEDQTEPVESTTAEEPGSEGVKKPPLKDVIIFICGVTLCGGFLLGSKIRSVIKAKKAEREDGSGQDDYDF